MALTCVDVLGWLSLAGLSGGRLKKIEERAGKGWRGGPGGEKPIAVDIWRRDSLTNSKATAFKNLLIGLRQDNCACPYTAMPSYLTIYIVTMSNLQTRYPET